MKEYRMHFYNLPLSNISFMPAQRTGAVYLDDGSTGHVSFFCQNKKTKTSRKPIPQSFYDLVMLNNLLKTIRPLDNKRISIMYDDASDISNQSIDLYDLFIDELHTRVEKKKLPSIFTDSVIHASNGRLIHAIGFDFLQFKTAEQIRFLQNICTNWLVEAGYLVLPKTKKIAKK